MHLAESKQQARFEALLERADKGLLDFDQLRELSQLYRVLSTRLSQQRSERADPEALRYLNALCVRASSHLYVPTPRARSAGGLWLHDLPGALERTFRMQLLAVGLLVLGASIGARLTLEDGANLGAMVPSSMYDASELQRMYDSEEARAAFLERKDPGGARNTLFAGMLFANNTRVGLLAFASGILFCVPTLLLVLYNGLTLGGFATIFMRDHSALPFLAWLVPHAIPELLAVVLCAAGGLAMGLAALCPGRPGRTLALRAAARDAFLLLAVAVPLLVVAAVIESFVRESLLSTAARAMVALASSAILVGYVAAIVILRRRRQRVSVAFLEHPAQPLKAARPRGSASSD